MADNMTLVVPEALRDEAKIRAVREKVSLSALVRAWLEAWVAGELPTPAAALGKDSDEQG